MRHLRSSLWYLSLIAATTLSTACGSIKEQTGAFVTEAVVDHIVNQVDERLERRGLSIAQISSIADINADGNVSMDEVRATAKAAASELIVSEADTLARNQRREWEAATRNLVTRDEANGVKGDLQDFWKWLKTTFGLLVTTIISYLVKQVFSAKSDGRRDANIAMHQARMDALERLLQRDLNNDGVIGGSADDQQPPPQPV